MNRKSLQAKSLRVPANVPAPVRSNLTIMPPRPEPAPPAPLTLSVVIPTYNESANVPRLLEKLEAALQDVSWEAIFVDDHSPDGTSDVVREIARRDPRVRSIERINRRGLASACIEGILAASAPHVAVIDADLQHDEAILPKMLETIQSNELDLVIASRNISGGSMGEFAANRVRLSQMGQRASQLICKCDVTDPMSGFFMVEAKYFREAAPRLTGTGFKILVDLLASSRNPRLAEVPYTFRNREAGESKLDLNVRLEYLFLIVDKLIGRWVPTRFVLFVLVGLVGVVLHLALLGALYRLDGVRFGWAQAIATTLPMTTNFLLNNVITFRDRKLRGLRLLGGFLTFFIACSIGAIVNIAFAEELMDHAVPWYLAGAAGITISSVWNYGVSTVLTWRKAQARCC